MSGDIYVSFGAETGALEAAIQRAKTQLKSFTTDAVATLREMAKSGADMDSALGAKLKDLGASATAARAKIAELRGGLTGVKGSGAAEEIEKVAGGLNMMQKAEGVHVLKSIVDEIMAGQSPMRAFAMEAGRIGQILSAGGIGVSMGAAGAAIAAVGGAFALLAFRAYEAGQAVRGMQLDAAVNGFTLAAEGADKVRRSLEQLADVGASDAAAIYKAFAPLGPVGETIAQLVAPHLADLAAAMGKKVPEAAGALASRFIDLDGDGLKWVQTMSRLDAGLAETAIKAINAGDKTGAYSAIIALLDKSLGDTTQQQRLHQAATIDQAAAMVDAAQAGVAFDASEQHLGEATAAATAKIEAQANRLKELRSALQATKSEADRADMQRLGDGYDTTGAKLRKLKDDHDKLDQAIEQTANKPDQRALHDELIVSQVANEEQQKTVGQEKADPRGAGRDKYQQDSDALTHYANTTRATQEQIIAGEIAMDKRMLAEGGYTAKERLQREQELEAKQRELRDATEKAGETSDKDALGATQAAIEGEIRAVTDRYRMETEHLGALVRLKKMGADESAAKVIAKLKEEGAAVDALYAKELALSGLTATKKQEIRNKQLAADDQIAIKEQETQDRAAAASERAWEQAAGTIESSLNSALRGMITGTQTFKQSMTKALEDMGFKVLELGEKWAVSSFLQPNLAPMMAAAARAIGIDVAQTAAGATAWFAPILGPAAPAAGAAVAAGIGGIGMMDIGAWNIPHDQLAMVHKNELVMPAAQAGAFRSMLSGATGDGGAPSVAIHPTTNVHLNALDGASVASWMRANSGDMLKAIDGAVRSGAALGLRRLRS